MRTIFGLFPDYEEAQAAIETFLCAGYEQSEIGVLIHQTTAKNNMTAHLHRVTVDKTDPGSDMPAIERILGGEQALHVPDAGPVWAGGPLATILADAASSSSGLGLERAFTNFAFPPELARLYRDGIVWGKVLVSIRAESEHAGEIGSIMQRHNAAGIKGIP